jgi:hypothetical protein
MFITLTHPSQMRDEKVRRIVKAYTSKHNQRHQEKRAHQNQVEDYPSPPSTDEEQETNAFAKRILDEQAVLKQLEEKSTANNTRPQECEAAEEQVESQELQQDEAGLVLDDNDEDVEEIVREDLDDVFPDFGNLHLSYLENYPSKYAKTRLPQLFEFYLRVYGPNYVWRPTLTTDAGFYKFKRNFFEMSMEQPVLLETLFALCQFRLDFRAFPEQSLSVLRHRSRVLVMVRQALEKSPEVCSDAVCWAIVGMMALDVLYSNWVSFQANLSGVRRLIALKGGVDSLGWDQSSWFKDFFNWAELRWFGHVVRLNTTREAYLELPVYPTHPFPRTLCKTISELPRGLEEISLSQGLSDEVLDIQKHLSIWRKRYTKDCLSIQEINSRYHESMHLTLKLAKTLGSLKLKQTERLICIGTLCYIVTCDGHDRIERWSRDLEDYIVNMEQLCVGLDPSHGHTLLWVALIIATSLDSTVSSLLNRWLLFDWIMDTDFYKWEWVKVLKTAQEVFWDDSLNNRGEACWQAALERKERRQIDRDTAQLGRELQRWYDDL